MQLQLVFKVPNFAWFLQGVMDCQCLVSTTYLDFESTYSESFIIGNSEPEWVQLGRWSSQQTNLTQQTNIGGAS